MPALGAGDSGFESLHSDIKKKDREGLFSWYNKVMKKKHAITFVIIMGLGILFIVAAFFVGNYIARRGSVGVSHETSGAPAVAISSLPPAQAAPANPNISVTGIVAGQTVSLPLPISGMIRGNWFFEGSFLVTLENPQGTVLARGLASSTQNWMTTNMIPFTVTIPAVAYQGPANLVFHQENPSGDPAYDASYSISVIVQ